MKLDIPNEEKPASVWDTVRESVEIHGPLEEEIDLPNRDTKTNRPSPLEEKT